jgi:tetratricopeptide (TPR) repeat protein
MDGSNTKETRGSLAGRTIAYIRLSSDTLLDSSKLPSEFDLRPEFDRRIRNAPEKIRRIVAKGQGKQDCCVAFAEMMHGCYRGTWGNGSMRFLHCVCMMIDDGTPTKGTTMRSGFRAMIGWGTCDEDLWPSNVDLDKSEFEDWKSIPKVAWDDARLKRIQNNKALVASVPCPVLKLGVREFRLLTHCFNVLRGEDKQFELRVIDSEFETVAWATLRAHVRGNQIVLEDLFVKPEFRRTHLGTALLHRIEQIACLEKPFTELNHEILVPITKPDAGPTRYCAARDFFLANGYLWKNTEPIRKYLDYSIFTATKKLDCAAIHNGYAVELLRSKKYSKGEEHLRIALQLEPNNARIHMHYGVLLAQLKRYSQAEDQLRQAMEIDDQDAQVSFIYASLMRELGRDEEAEKYYLRTLQIKEDFPQVHNDYADLLRRIRRPSDAETHYKRALEFEEFAETHYGYALLLVDLKRYEEAEYHFLRALELRKEFPEADKAYAKLLRCLGRCVEAEKYYRQALENKEDYADAHADYAFLLANLKRYKESEKHYLRAIEIKEKHARWVDAGYLHGELGGTYEEQGRLDHAETHYAKVLEISIRTGNDWLHKQASHDLARLRQHLNNGDQES